MRTMMDQLKKAVSRVGKELSSFKDKSVAFMKKTKKNLSKSGKRSKPKKGAKVGKYNNLHSKRKAKKDAKARKKAQYLATLPKNRWKRLVYRMHPKRAFKYWFSKEGGIRALKIAGIGFVFMVIFTLGLFAYYRRELPNPREINSRLLEQTTKFYDRTGEVLLFEVYGDQNRTVVEFDQISEHMRNATVAIEDKDFYNHNGFSISGTIRAAWSNFTSGDATGQGGSTITQQFIKNSLLTDEKTYTRKIKELILSIELERLYTKEEILSFYLNEIPYGSLEYGVEAAARAFFDKPASELTIAESAMMAALPQAPSLYSPYGDNTDLLVSRTHTIIDLMEEQGYITSEEAAAAKDVDILAKVIPIEERSLYDDIKAPHFVLEVQSQLEEQFTPQLVKTGGLKIITTLDWDLQKRAERAVRQNMKTVINPAAGGGSGDNAALVASENQTGHVLAMVGSRNFKHPGYGSFNAAVANRQPGSSFKPFGYSELFKNERWGPDSLIYDTPTSFGDYEPKNFDFSYRGKMTVRQALGESRNIPAVKALYIAGVQNTIDLAKAMGNKSLGSAEQYGLSLVLGAGEVKLAEHTHAYGTFARHGNYVPQTYVLKVENADGEVLQEWTEPEPEQVLNEEIAYLMTDVLTDDQARSGTFGLGNPRLVVPGLTHAVKTGTTDRSVDGWMMGYSSYMSVGVWVGNHDNTPMDSITSWQTGPIWTQFMRQAHNVARYSEDRPIFETRPDGIKTVEMDRATGYAATDKSKNTYNGIFPSWYERQEPDETQKYTIDKISGFLATECTPERAREQATASGNWPELLPDDPWFSLWAKSTPYGSNSGKPSKQDNVHDCDDDLPSVGAPYVDENPEDGVYTFAVNVSEGDHDLDTVNWKINGQIVSSQNASGSGTYSYTHVFNSGGTKKITVEVIDEVLYDNQNSTTESVSAFSPAGIQLDPPIIAGNNVFFNWNSEPAADEYEVCWRKSGGNTDCSFSNDTSENENLDDGTYQAWVSSRYNGAVLEISPNITFTVD